MIDEQIAREAILGLALLKSLIKELIDSFDDQASKSQVQSTQRFFRFASGELEKMLLKFDLATK